MWNNSGTDTTNNLTNGNFASFPFASKFSHVSAVAFVLDMLFCPLFFARRKHLILNRFHSLHHFGTCGSISCLSDILENFRCTEGAVEGVHLTCMRIGQCFAIVNPLCSVFTFVRISDGCEQIQRLLVILEIIYWRSMRVSLRALHLQTNAECASSFFMLVSLTYILRTSARPKDTYQKKIAFF